MTKQQLVLGIDPGPTKSGMVLYEATARRVLRAWKAADIHELEQQVRLMYSRYIRLGVKASVAVEQVSAGGVSANSLFETQLVAGRVVGWCDVLGVPVETYYRRDVLRALNCNAKGKSKDSQVRAALIEIHGGSSAVGRKSAPGPLYGTSSHAWQALGVVYTHAFPWGHSG
tara:strand:+ start:133 stop:645 length:513 start_codon:yes stop_codon:yes gene_type:complete